MVLVFHSSSPSARDRCSSIHQIVPDLLLPFPIRLAITCPGGIIQPRLPIRPSLSCLLVWPILHYRPNQFLATVQSGLSLLPSQPVLTSPARLAHPASPACLASPDCLAQHYSLTFLRHRCRPTWLSQPFLHIWINIRRVFVGSIRSDCNPIRTVIFSCLTKTDIAIRLAMFCEQRSFGTPRTVHHTKSCLKL